MSCNRQQGVLLLCLHQPAKEITMDDRILFWPEMKKIIGLSRPTIWRMEKTGGFPSRRQISAGRVAWLKSEVQDWIDSRESVGREGW